MNKEITIIADYTEEVSLTVVEVCEIFDIEDVSLQDLISYGVLQPVGKDSGEWSFDMTQLKRLRMALRLQRDLELNAAGVALVMELLEELETLRAQSTLLHKHLLK